MGMKADKYNKETIKGIKYYDNECLQCTVQIRN